MYTSLAHDSGRRLNLSELRSVEPVSLRNQKSNDLFDRHGLNRSMSRERLTATNLLLTRRQLEPPNQHRHLLTNNSCFSLAIPPQERDEWSDAHRAERF